MIPHLFYKKPIAKITNQDLLQAISEVKKQENKEAAIEKSLEIIVKKFKGYRFRTYIYFWRLFEDNPNTLWDRDFDFMHCHHQNLFLRILLVKSGQIKEEDISLGFSAVWYISPHQYLKINLGNKTVGVDPWNQTYGAKWDEHASGFGFKRIDTERK